MRKLQKTAIRASGWIILLAALAGSPVQRAVAQDYSLINKDMQALTEHSSAPGWYDFRDDVSIDPLTIFHVYKTAFELGPDDGMELFKTQPDELGMIHYRYRQVYRGIPVFGADFVVHSRDGRTVSANGRIVPGIRAASAPAVSEDAAVQAAIAAVPATSYAWQNPELENLVREQTGDPEATNYPKGSLVIVDDGMSEFDPARYRLGWKIDVWVFENGTSTTVYVDALTGKVIRTIPLARQCDGGTVNSTWYGTRAISTDLSGSSYILYDDCTGSHPYTMRTRDYRTGSVVNFTDGNNSWTTNLKRSAGTTHWNLHNVSDYYSTVHGRNSFSGTGSNIEARLVASSVTNNACWDCLNNIISYYDGATTTPTDDWNTIDIIAHEFTHGVTEYSADLVYNKESGALNESFSDIFGEATENWILGSNDWLVGQERGAIRSFINPNSYGDPDCYKGTNWYSTTSCTPSSGNDQCGVHTNSSVQNYWFYLLTVGGSGSNDFGEDYSVSGIGITAARAIAYRNLTVYLTTSSQYIDARRGALRSARDLYGACSNQEIQCGKAWFACHVGNTLTRFNYQICGTISGSGNPFYQGINSVYSGGSGCGTLITTSSGNVTYAAGNYIRLLTGFRAYATGTNRFVAYLEPCSYTVWKTAPAPAAQVPDRWDERNGSAPVRDEVSVLPNPFTRITAVNLELADGAEVRIMLFDRLGRFVASPLPGQFMTRGHHLIEVDGATLVPGVYVLDIAIGGDRFKKQIVKLE